MGIFARYISTIALLFVFTVVSPRVVHAQSLDPDKNQNQEKNQEQAQTGDFQTYFVSLRAAEINMRTGPGYRYPITWVYQRRDLPVKVIDRFDHWRQIQDFDGDNGWVHKNLLSNRTMGLVIRNKTPLYRKNDSGSLILAQAEKGNVGAVEVCEKTKCYIEIQGYEGWVDQDALWGVD